LSSDDSWAPIREFSADKRRRRFPWEAVAALVVVSGLLGWFLVPRYREMKAAAQEKVILDHVFKYLSGADQFFREHPGRLFVRHDELVGPGRPVPADFGPEAGEDYGVLFPLRRDLARLAVQTTVGRRLIWFSHDDPDGKPWRDRVSQRADGELTGVAEMIKAYHELLARESHDGVLVKLLPDGSRLETTYRGGVPHGPFKAFFPDGKSWGEANYENGRVAGPCWNYSRAGVRFDELSPADLSQPLKTVL
jgi:hypothetical protein